MMNILPKDGYFRHSPLTAALGCVFTLSAFGSIAQETVQDETSVEQEKQPERIIVVGSRIRTDGMDNATPLEIINADIAVGQGITNLGELLRNSTVAAGSNQVTSAASTAFVTEGGTGTESIQLRGMGANRTLVLLNGRRAGPAGTRGQVSSFDLNVLPLSAIERVEILKDGASSLYGSDAVAGVINIVTKKGDDSSINANLSQPSETGGESMGMDFTFGRTFDKGSFRVLADYKKQKELAKGQRDYFRCGERYVFDPATGERADNIDPRTGEYHCNDLLWGHVWIYDYQDDGNVPSGTKAQYDYDGNLGQFIPGFAVDASNPDYMVAPPGWYPVAYDAASDAVTNADHPFQDLESLIPQNELITAYAQGDYQLTDSVTLYGEALLNRRTTTNNSYRQFWSYQYNEDFFAGNPLSAGWTGAQWLSPTPITDHSGSKITVDYRRFVVGLSGEFGDWFWDATYQNSHNKGRYRNKIIYDDAITDFNFLDGSCVGLTTSVRGVSCIDVPWLDPQFLAGNITGAVRDFLFGEEEGDTIYKQQSAEFNITGDLMELPAGSMAGAFGVQFQKDSIVDTPGDVTLAGNAWGSSGAGITKGKSDTKAAYGEINIPVINDMPLAESLDLTVSARYTDVSSYGSDTTYKVGVNWLIGNGVRLRASRGTSFRSPALYELYLNNQTSFASTRSIDPCINWADGLEAGTTSETVAANCQADAVPGDYGGGAISTTVTSGGGEGYLEAETSVAKTLGLVWMPQFDGFDLSFSADYFDINIEGEVTLLSASQIVGNCYSSDNFATEPLCGQFVRDRTNPDDPRITDVTGGYRNIAGQINRGVDFQLAYAVTTPIGDLNVRYEHTLQLEATRQLFPTSVPEDHTGEFGSPENVGNLTIELRHDDWTVNWLARYVGSVENHTHYGDGTYRDDATIRGEEVRVVLSSDAVIYHTISASKEFGDSGFVATLGVANAFDKAPPRVTTVNVGELDTVGNSAFYSQYDWLGRRFFANVSYSF